MDTTTTGETVVKKVDKLANIPFIPDDLLSNILSRLPAKSAIRCRLVCKRWKDLTFDRYFVDLQLIRNSNIPTIFVANLELPGSRFDLFAYDKWWEPAESIYNNHRFPLYAWKFWRTSLALFSHAGIVVFRVNQYDLNNDITILNPTSRENVRITFDKHTLFRRSWTKNIYGVYFHPLLKEYCSLWMTQLFKSPKDHTERIQYYMLTLGSNPSLKQLSNPFSNRLIKRDNESPPVLINNYLYWMLECDKHTGYKYHGRNDIMKFDIISEEFTVIPCPVPLDIKCKFYQTHLVNIDDFLSFLLIRPFKITIWRMEDHAHKFFQTAATEYTFNIQIRPIPHGIAVVVDGKLALWSEWRKLRVYNLKEGSVMKKNYQKRKYGDPVMFLSHQMSLASLRNCKPTIFIDEEDGQLVITPTDEDGCCMHIHRRRRP